jgi:hypothetical protein
MRKLVFAALAGVFMWSSGFVVGDKNTETSVEGIYVSCNYAITRHWVDHNLQPQEETHYFYGTADNDVQCAGRQRHHIAGLNMGVRAW